MFKDNIFFDEASGLSLDFNGLQQSLAAQLPAQADMLRKAQADMRALEGGAIANPDEQRMVGHYWLRAPQLAPTPEIRQEIEEVQADITQFVARVHKGEILACNGQPFKNALVVGIGGSSLGPVFVSEALRSAEDKMRLYFIDNTDPDGMDMVLQQLEPQLAQTMVIVISKSGGTVETQNGLVEVKACFAEHRLNFHANAVRITQKGSAFDTAPDADKWLASFPMWDWVGGRTSVLSAVGLLPLALQGIDCRALLNGAAACDLLGRQQPEQNPSLLLALCWHLLSGGQGGTSMAVLPYKDRLQLFAKYLQQLIMESIGKEYDLAGQKVQQGLAVFGNKGSSDQHSYVQQLVAGPENVFVAFIEVLRDRALPEKAPIVRDDSTSGDYLQAFMLGTSRALHDHGKNSLIITVPAVTPFTVGMLIALFERAVGYYASFVGINAYHQPAVEFGKNAAGEIIALKNRLLQYLAEHKEKAFTAAELAAGLDADMVQVWHLLRHLGANMDSVLQCAANDEGNLTFKLVK